jgi:hypothetical protein
MKYNLMIAAQIACMACFASVSHAAPVDRVQAESGVVAFFDKPYGFSEWKVSPQAKSRSQITAENTKSDSWSALRDRKRLDETIDMIQVDAHDARNLDDAEIALMVEARLLKTEKSCKKGGNSVSWQPVQGENVIASNIYVCRRDRYNGPEIFSAKVGVGVAVWAMREGDSVFLFQYVGFRPEFRKGDVDKIASQMAYRANKVWPINLVMATEQVALNSSPLAAN